MGRKPGELGMTRNALAAMLLGIVTLAAPSLVCAQQIAAAQRPLTVDSTIGDLLDNAPARAVLARLLPTIVDNAQIDQARAFTLRQIAPSAKGLITAALLNAINEELARTPGAVGPASAVNIAAITMPLRLETVRLWEGRAPGATGDQPEDIPTLTIVKPDGIQGVGTAVIVAPGGGYTFLAAGYEGRMVGDWFAAHGITAFVLTYRLTPAGYRYPSQLNDAQRSIRWVRANARRFGIQTNRIGMIGFSAGGHLTAMTETLFDAGNAKARDPVERESSRPDFAVLGYPVIDLGASGWERVGLVKGAPNPITIKALSPALNVRSDTPPTFIVHTTTDALVPATNSTLFFNALYAAKVPVELHIIGDGPHGFGLGMSYPALSTWTQQLENWLGRRGFISSASGAAGAPR
jgi:acetyl esterase/lipase